MLVSDYTGINVAELKEFCKVRGFATTGKKQDIVRLLDFDTNGPI